MPKYTPKQLKSMAQTFIADRAADGDRSFRVIMSIALVTGMHPNLIVTKIKELAA